MIQETARRLGLGGLALAVATFSVQQAQGYSFNQVGPDGRQPASLSGGSACPVRAHRPTGSGSVAVQWSTAFGTNPVAILTQDQTTSGRLNEIEQAIQQSLGVWTGVSGTTLIPTSLAPLARTAVANACGSDGLNSICFDQNDAAFTPGGLAFTRVITSDRIGEQIGSAISAEVGQILDADIYFSSSDPRTAFATPLALFTNPNAYDLESILTHELGHFLGFSHSAVWSAMMFPYAHMPGTFATPRPTAGQPDAPLGDDDRTGLRVLYPDPTDLSHSGSIMGRVLPANPISLPVSPSGVTGIFGPQMVAVDQATGSVIGGAISGWSCTNPGPVQFDGGYKIEKLAVGKSYIVYAEPLNGAVDPSQIGTTAQTLCRNAATDSGWPAQFSC